MKRSKNAKETKHLKRTDKNCKHIDSFVSKTKHLKITGKNLSANRFILISKIQSKSKPCLFWMYFTICLLVYNSFHNFYNLFWT